MTGQKKVEREGAGTAETSHIAADPAPARRRRLTAARKQEAVLRVLPGETVQPVARNIDATAADVSGWRDAFPEGGVSNLSVYNAIAANAGSSAGYRNRFTIRSAFFLAVLSPALSLNLLRLKSEGSVGLERLRRTFECFSD